MSHLHLHIYREPNADVLKIADSPPDTGPVAPKSAGDSPLANGAEVPKGSFAFPADYFPAGGILGRVANDSPLLKRLNDLVTQLQGRGASAAEIATQLKQFLHSPAVAILVQVTPFKWDDLLLPVLQAAFPMDV